MWRVALVLASLALWLLSGWFGVGLYSSDFEPNPDPNEPPLDNWNVWVCTGRVEVYRITWGSCGHFPGSNWRLTPTPEVLDFQYDWPSPGEPERPFVIRLGFEGMIRRGMAIPLWIPVAVSGVWWLRRAGAKRWPREHCRACGYPLKGLPASTGELKCPECGPASADRSMTPPAPL
jgi:hypothetical protein